MTEEQRTLLTRQHLIHAAHHLPHPVMDMFDADCWICRQAEADMLVFEAGMILAGCDIYPEEQESYEA